MNDALVAQLFTGFGFVAVLGGIGLIVGVVAGILLLRGVRVPGAVTAVTAVAPALAPVVAALVYTGGADPRGGAVTVASTAFTTGLATVGIVGVVGVLLAVAGARRSPRHRAVGALAVVGVIGVVALTVVAGVSVDNALFGNFRAAIYAVLGLLLSVAMLGGGDDADGGGDVAAGAALCLPLLVAAGEAAERGLMHLMLLQRLPGLPVGQRAEMVTQFLAFFEVELLWGTAAVGVASLVATLGAVDAWRRGGGPLALVGLVWLLAALLVLFGPGLDQADLLAAAAAMPVD